MSELGDQIIAGIISGVITVIILGLSNYLFATKIHIYDWLYPFPLEFQLLQSMTWDKMTLPAGQIIRLRLTAWELRSIPPDEWIDFLLWDPYLNQYNHHPDLRHPATYFKTGSLMKRIDWRFC